MSTLSGKHANKPNSFATQDCLTIIAIGMLTCLPLYLYGLPLVLDLNHHYRTALGFYESIVNGNYYPSWHPSTNGGYGDLSVRFYPPALYFMLCGFRLITRDWFLAGLLTATSLTTAGLLGMYLWARSFTSRYYALAAGLLFALSPFHVNELYQSGMYGQYAAASVLPFVFAFVERIIRAGRNSDAALLGLSYGLLVLCNVPLAVLGSISIAVYTLVRLIQSFKVGSVYRLVAGVVLGVAMSCFYWLPVLRELKWKYPSGIGQGAWFDYRNNFLFHSSPSEMSNFLLPFLAAVTIAMAVPSTILIFKKDRRVLAPGTVALLGFFMATSLSKPVWDKLPLLQETQFPWRWMTISSACLSLLAAISFSEMYSMWRSRQRALSLIFTGFVLLTLSFTIFQLIRGAIFSDRVTFNQKVESLRASDTNQDFLPVWAHGQVRKMNSEIEAPGRAVTVLDWSAERKIFSLEQGQETNVRLKVYYYPYWLASANGQRLVTTPADDGALMISVPSEKATVVVEFTEPLTTCMASAISILALLIMGLLLVLPLTQSVRSARLV
jgi:uncharacterized membrane protein